MRFLLLTSLTLLFTATAFSQSKQSRSEYQLLWKISGKGLAKPSYLFGTMHVRDKRAFDFSDSVIHKIRECESFALEVHPDSASKAVFIEILNNQEDTFKKLLSESDYQELDSIMKLKSGYSLQRLRSPAMAEFMLTKDLDNKDNETFLDAWLYLYARNQGKSIFGLEDAHSQLSKLFNSPRKNIKVSLLRYLQTDSMQPYYKKMLDIYYQGEINKIEDFISEIRANETEYVDELLNKRNHDMLKSILANIHSRTAFMAVGAAHLPGKEGLLELLRQSGYTVTLVKPTFTGLSKKIKINTNQEAWKTFPFDDGAFSVQMPGAPFPIKIDSLGLTTNIYLDFKGPTFFQAMHTLITGKSSASEMLERIEKNVIAKQSTSTTPKGKRYKINGYEALDIPIINKSYYSRGVYIIRGQVLCMLMVGPTKDVAYGNEAERFIQSFKGIDVKNKKWKPFKDEPGAFSVLMSGQSRQNVKHVKDGDFEQDIFITMSDNIAKQELYLVRYNDFPPGYMSTNDSIYFAAVAEDFIKNVNGINQHRNETSVSGLKAVEYSFKSEEGSWIQCRMTLRGNRFYMLMGTRVNDQKGESDIEYFMDSFKFEDFKSSVLRPYDIEGVTTWLPMQPQYDSSSSSPNRAVYNSADKNSGIQFTIIKSELGLYVSESDPQKYFQSSYDLDKEDSIVWSKDISTSQWLGQEYIVQSTKIDAVKRIRHVVNGRDMYTFILGIPGNYSGDIDQRFYDSLVIKNQQSSWSLIKRKTDLLLSDLKSMDSTIHDEATQALWSYKFNTDETPKLYAAIRDEAISYSVKSTLFNKLDATDSSHIGFIAEVFSSLPDSSRVREEALAVLSEIDNKRAHLLLIDLLKRDTTHTLDAFTVLYPFFDSLELIQPIVIDLMKLKNRFDGSGYLYYLIKRGFEDSLFNQTITEKIQEQLLKESHALNEQALVKLTQEELDNSNVGYDYHQLARVFTLVPFNSDVKLSLSKLVDTGAKDAMLVAIPHLLKNGVSVRASDINILASDMVYRVDFWNALAEVKQEKVFTKAYGTQAKMAEGLLIRYMNYDDYLPEKVELIGIQKIKQGGKQKKIYAFQCFDGEKWYLGLSGPFEAKEIMPTQTDLVFNTYIEYNKGKDNLYEKVKSALEEYDDVEVIKK